MGILYNIIIALRKCTISIRRSGLHSDGARRRTASCHSKFLQHEIRQTNGMFSARYRAFHSLVVALMVRNRGSTTA